jgi:hypothetical protein
MTATGSRPETIAAPKETVAVTAELNAVVQTGGARPGCPASAPAAVYWGMLRPLDRTSPATQTATFGLG